MTWEPPGFEEIKMDAEFTAYCEDLDDAPEVVAPAAASACDSGS